MRARGPLLALAIAIAVVVVVAFASRSDRRDGPPYSPTSTAPDGAKALVELLERFGTEVTIRDGMPPPGQGPVLVLQRIGTEPALEDQVVDAFEDHARAGGRVVVGSAESELAPRFAESLEPDAVQRAGRCPLGLDGVARLTGLRARFRVDDAVACFGDDDRAAVLYRPVGEGEIVSVAGPELFTNQYLDEEDNAVLVTALLSGQGPVTFVQPGVPFNGDKGLLALLPRGVVLAMVQLLIAFALFVWASARRLGRPVREPMLWALPGTAFADGMGQLLQRAGRPHLAARWLRRRARRQLARRYGLGAGAGAAEIAAAMSAGGRVGAAAAVAPGAVVASASGSVPASASGSAPATAPGQHDHDHDRYAAVVRTLEDGHVPDAQGLLDLAERIDRLRHEVPQ